MAREAANAIASPTNQQLGPVPSFVIIGAMKAGTTSLYQYLARHPQLFLCPEKEPMYFSRGEVYSRGENWYRSLFVNARTDQQCGEASTCYTRAPHYDDVPPRMARLIPQARLIYILRHPVERAYSHYRWDMQGLHLRGDYNAMTFEQALEQTSEYLDTSCYLQQIERYLEYFSLEQIHVLTLEELKGHTQAALRRCQEFLNVSVRDLTDEGAVVANPSDGRQVSNYRLRKHVGRIRRLPLFRRLIDALPTQLRRGAKRQIVNALDKSFVAKRMRARHASAVSPLTESTRRALLQRLAKPTQDLEEFLGRRLPTNWLE